MRFQSAQPDGKIGRQLVHDVDILDASGSMSGPKYSSAIEGINKGIEELKADDSVDYTKTVIEFDHGVRTETDLTFEAFQNRRFSKTNIMQHYFMDHKSKLNPITGFGAKGGTPLYQTVGETIQKLLTKVKPTDKVLIKIFTDGEENSSEGEFGGYNGGKKLKELMDKVQRDNNFTITFIGTKFDVDRMVNQMGISQLNSLVHDNTSRGIELAYKGMNKARASYSMSVASGQTVGSTGEFFKGINTEE